MFYTEKPTELALAAVGLPSANERKPTCEPVRVSTISQSFFLGSAYTMKIVVSKVKIT